MKIIFVHDFNMASFDDNLCVCLGNFDGVHIGHQKLIETSKLYNMKSSVITFSPHPYLFLKNIKDYKLLSPLDAKIDIFESFHIDYLIIVKFDNVVANISKEVFMDFLKRINTKKIVIGEDFKFAKHAEGKVRDLQTRFDVEIVPKVEIENIRVSTTYVKELLSDGNIELANKLLNRKYFICGKVVKGNKVGRTIGYPTANIDTGLYFLPKNGVYKAQVEVDNKLYNGMVNIGYNPTINFTEEIRFEVHIIDFNEFIYEKTIKICLESFIRKERKFNTKEELIKQLEIDKNKCSQ